MPITELFSRALKSILPQAIPNLIHPGQFPLHPDGGTLCPHLHGFAVHMPIPIRLLDFRPGQMRAALAPGAIVHDLVAKDIAVDAEVVLARLALVPARLAGALGALRQTAVRALVRGRERRQAAEALRRVLLARALPGDFDPVAQREEVVVGAGEVRGEDEGEVAGRAGRGQVADFGAAARAQVAAARELAVAGAEGCFVFCHARGEAHH